VGTGPFAPVGRRYLISTDAHAMELSSGCKHRSWHQGVLESTQFPCNWNSRFRVLTLIPEIKSIVLIKNNFRSNEATKIAGAELTNAVMRWRCNSRSILTCITLLSHELGPKLSTNASALLTSWSNDLKRLRYLEPPVVPLRRGGMQTPCLGHHGLGGLTFQVI
jgi:hypothetical protein